jgi:hypothetical protein
MDERMQTEDSTMIYFISGTNSVAHSKSQLVYDTKQWSYEMIRRLQG